MNVLLVFGFVCLVCASARVAVRNNEDLELPSNAITEAKSKPDADNVTNNSGLKITSNKNGITIYELESTTEKRNATNIKIDLEVHEHSNTTEAETIRTEVVKTATLKGNIINEVPLLLTPFITRGKAKRARKASKVNPDLFFGLASHSGFLTIDEKYNSNLFFWYFPVPEKPVCETPWIIWLQGGPGASVMTGLFDEIGPIMVDKNLELKLRSETWGKEHSLLFIENPVGTGYSFTNDTRGYAHHTNISSLQLYAALQQFLQIFPELREAPLFIAGESYAGKYIPGLAMEIHRNKDTHEQINLQGLSIGNGYLDPTSVANYSRVAYHFGLVDADGATEIRKMEDDYMKLLRANNSVAAKNQWQNTVFTLHLMSLQPQLYNFLKDDLGIRKYESFLRRAAVKSALHVGNIPYAFVNMTVNAKMAPDFLSDFKPVLEELLEHYKVLMYSGQLDMMIPYVLTAENTRTWRWSGAEQFASAERHPWICSLKACSSKVAGFHKSGGNLTEVLVRGAGHTVPMDQPAAARDMIQKFVRGEQLGGRSIVEAYRDMEKKAGRTAENIYL